MRYFQAHCKALFDGNRYSAMEINYYYYFYFHHSLCWCSLCASAGCKPCTLGISHPSQSFCSNTKHFSEDSCRSRHADLLDFCHISTLGYFLDVFFNFIPFFTVPSAPTTTGITIVFICHILCISSSFWRVILENNREYNHSAEWIKREEQKYADIECQPWENISLDELQTAIA